MPQIYPFQRPPLPFRKKIRKRLGGFYSQLKSNAKPLAIIALILVSLIVFQDLLLRQPSARFNKHTFKLRVADSDQARQRGLSHSSKLKDNEAMLFVFDRPGKHCFWMKDMNYPIDILWFDKSKKLIHVVHEVGPETYPTNFCPTKDDLYVLEVQSGVAGMIKTRIGDQIVLPKL